MSESYYTVLGVPRQASDEEIRKAYRTRALASHPQKHAGEGKARAEAEFRSLAEAFDVLGDERKRAAYDEGALEAVAGRDPLEVFTELFGSPNPFAQKLGGAALQEQPAAAVSRPEGEAAGAGGETVVEVGCTLEELYRGCTKRAVAGGGRSKDLQIQAGWKSGTRITYPGEGAGGGDLTFVLAEAKHKSFRRSGRNLVYTAHISLADALAGSVVEVTTLDGRVLPVGVHDIVRPGYTKRVPGEGFPSAKKKGRRGDLVIEFRVRYPSKLSEQQRLDLRRVLPA